LWRSGTEAPAGESIVIPLCPRDELFGPVDIGKYLPGYRTLKGLRIFSGCGRSHSLFAASNRPKTIEIMGTIFKLRDICAWQDIPLPRELLDRIQANLCGWGGAMTKTLAIKIIDVYRGTRHNTTYLTEVEPEFE